MKQVSVDLLSIFEQHKRWHELQTPLLGNLLAKHANNMHQHNAVPQNLRMRVLSF